MDAYVYQGGLLCEGCARRVKSDRIRASIDAIRDDSDYWPQGPYANGGGEADCPQHCGRCGEFLKNPLTGDGVEYVRERSEDRHGDDRILAQWAGFYAAELAD